MKLLPVLLLAAACSSGGHSATVCGERNQHAGGPLTVTVSRDGDVGPVAVDGHLYVGRAHGVPAGEHAAEARGSYPKMTLTIGTVVVPLDTSGCD